MASYFASESGTVNGGSGTDIDPWGPQTGPTLNCMERALDGLITQNPTDGDILNLSDASTITLTKNFDTSTYGVPTQTARLTIRGYTTSEGDGGKATIDGAATYGMVNTAVDYVDLIDLTIQNSGSAKSIDMDNFCNVIRCTCDNRVDLDAACTVFGCDITATGSTIALLIENRCVVAYNWLSAGTAEAIYSNNVDTVIYRNIVNMSGAGVAIRLTQRDNSVDHNSILGTSNAGTGILFVTTNRLAHQITNNLIEGVATGINFASPIDNLVLYAGNAFRDNTTDESGKQNVIIDEDNELALGSALYAKSGANTFANRATYFAPADVGNLRAGAWGGLGLDKGAVQSVAAGGGGTTGRQGLHSIESGAV